MIQFDRSGLVSSIQAAIFIGASQPGTNFPMQLVVDGRAIGAFLVRIK